MTMDVNSPEAALWSETMRLKSENENLRAVLDSVRQWDSLYDALPDKLAQHIVAALAPHGDGEEAR